MTTWSPTLKDTTKCLLRVLATGDAALSGCDETTHSSPTHTACRVKTMAWPRPYVNTPPPQKLVLSPSRPMGRTMLDSLAAREVGMAGVAVVERASDPQAS